MNYLITFLCGLFIGGIVGAIVFMLCRMAAYNELESYPPETQEQEIERLR